MEKQSQRNTEVFEGPEVPPDWNDEQYNSRKTKESTQLSNSIQDKVNNASNNTHIIQKVSSMPHDDIYILDASNLIIGYIENTMPIWKKWVDDHVAANKQLFVLPRSAAEVNGGLPVNGPFIILKSSDNKADNILDHVYEGK